jgi:aspartate kinase
MLTIRHYNDAILQKMIAGRTVELMQKTPETVQVVLKSL